MQLQKTSAWRNLFIFKAPLLCANHFFLINHTRKLFWHSNLNEPQRKKFFLIIFQLSEADIQPSSELFELLIQMSSLFIHVINSKSLSLISIQNSASITLNLGIFYIIKCRTSSRKEVRLYALPPHTIWEWRTEIKKFDLLYRITRPFIKDNLRFRMEGT